MGATVDHIRTFTGTAGPFEPDPIREISFFHVNKGSDDRVSAVL